MEASPSHAQGDVTDIHTYIHSALNSLCIVLKICTASVIMTKPGSIFFVIAYKFIFILD